MTTTPPAGISRRTLTRGAAWTVPVATLAGTAPALAASTRPPPCGCMKVGALGTFTAQSVTALNLGTVTGSIVYNLNSGACNTGFFKPLYTITGLGGTLSFSDGTSYTYSVGATTGTGTIGQVSAFTSTFSILGRVSMPNDLFSPYGPKIPTRLCFRFSAIFVPILPIPQVECRYQLCYDLSDPSSTGTVIAGTGTVNWADITPSNPVLTVG